MTSLGAPMNTGHEYSIRGRIVQGGSKPDTFQSIHGWFTGENPCHWRCGDADVRGQHYTAVSSACWVGLAVARVQRKIRWYQKWSEMWRLPINPIKCQVLVFGRSRAEAKVYIDGKVIPTVDTVKCLRVTFDKKMNFKKHVQDIAGRVRVRLAALAHTCKNEVSTETRVAIYKATGWFIQNVTKKRTV